MKAVKERSKQKENQPIKTQKEREREREILEIVETTLKANSVENRVNKISEKQKFTKRQRANSPDSSTSAASSEPEKRKLLIENTDAQIQMIQLQICTLHRMGQVRVVGGNKLKQYRPNSATRETIKELRKELEELKLAREALSEPESPPATVAPRTKLVTRNFIANQKGVGTQDDDKLALSLANILMIAEKTDITLGKWVTETNKDPELTLLSHTRWESQRVSTELQAVRGRFENGHGPSLCGRQARRAQNSERVGPSSGTR